MALPTAACLNPLIRRGWCSGINSEICSKDSLLVPMVVEEDGDMSYFRH